LGGWDSQEPGYKIKVVDPRLVKVKKRLVIAGVKPINDPYRDLSCLESFLKMLEIDQMELAVMAQKESALEKRGENLQKKEKREGNYGFVPKCVGLVGHIK